MSSQCASAACGSAGSSTNASYGYCKLAHVFVQMDPSGKSKGPPPMVKKVLSLFGSGREEDRMVGYLSFLKVSWRPFAAVAPDNSHSQRDAFTAATSQLHATPASKFAASCSYIRNSVLLDADWTEAAAVPAG